MKKKMIVVLALVMGIFLVTGCNDKKVKDKNDEPQNKDAAKFKEEYESLNGKKNAKGVEFRKISIDEENPYIYISAEDAVKKIENEETFYLYIGDKQCPWCRSCIEKSIEVAKKNKVDKIYYVSIWDDDHNEILRDKYSLNDDNEPTLDSKGTDAYYQLLKHFDSLLSDYTLTDADGNKIEVGEKRIFAPNYFYIEKGKAVKLISGTSDLQKSSIEELTEEMLADEEKQFSELFNN